MTSFLELLLTKRTSVITVGIFIGLTLFTLQSKVRCILFILVADH